MFCRQLLPSLARMNQSRSREVRLDTGWMSNLDSIRQRLVWKLLDRTATDSYFGKVVITESTTINLDIRLSTTDVVQPLI